MTIHQAIRLGYVLSTVPLFLVSGWVIKRYYDQYVETHRLLPHHVWLIATSYLLFVASSAIRVVQRWDHPVSRLLVNDWIAAIAGLLALSLILRHVNRLPKDD